MKKIHVALILLNLILMTVMWTTELRSKRFGAAPDSIDALSWGIASSISRDVYGLFGYVGYAKILNHFWNNGFTANYRYGYTAKPEENTRRTFEDIVWNKEENNRIIAESLKYNLPEGGENWGNQKIFATPANDVGYIDFISLGFNVFGYKMESLQLIYFTLLTIGLLAYITLFARNVPYLLLSGIFLVTMIMLGESVLFTKLTNVVAHHNQRFLDTLVILPIISLIAAKLNLTEKLNVALIATQIIIIALVMHFRSSTSWVVIILALLTLISLKSVSSRLKGFLAKIASILQSFCQSRIKNVFISLVGVIILIRIVSGLLTSPIYQFNEAIPHHMFWHNLYMGLTFHPDWVEKMGHRTDGQAKNDNAAWIAGFKRGREKYGLEQKYMMNFSGNSFGHINKRIHELMIKEEYAKVILKKPIFSLQLYLWYKPLITLKKYANIVFTAFVNMNGIIIISLITVLGFLAFLLRSGYQQQLTECFALVTVVMLGSMIPVFFTYPYEGLLGCSSWLLIVWIILGSAIGIDKISQKVKARS